MKARNYFNKLDEEMVSNFVAVSEKSNPFLIRIDNLTPTQILFLSEQYCFFSKNIISFFIDAIFVLSYHGYESISNELLMNIREELGEVIDDHHSKNNVSLPHYVYLRKSIIDSFSFDPAKSRPSLSTKNFISNMKSLVNIDNANNVSGTVYALEASAMLELAIVKKIISSKNTISESLEYFFDIHTTEIEIGHKLMLQKKCIKYLKNEFGYMEFSQGFNETLFAMDNWWIELYNESLKL